MKSYVERSAVVAVAFGILGLYLIWRGITGKVPMLSIGRPMFPRSVFIFIGAVFLGIPVLYFWVLFGV